MLEIKKFEVNPLEVNCYVVSDDTGEAVIIDPGMFAQSEWLEVAEYVKEKGLKVKHCLLTHMHFDHAMGCHFVDGQWELKPEGHADDVTLYKRMKEQTVMFFGMSLNIPPQPVVGTCHNEGAKIRFGSHEIEVLHTPGHSKGSVCYYIKNERTLLSGDTLFAGSMGRTDLEGGDNAEMMQSLLRLSELPEDTKVYPGHGPATNIENEKRWIQAVCRR